ncbi:MAG: hypothetical protein KKD86_14115 [Bacteroidetes bacterium]|nr:hypothetical protein [Bacteroidota bacterium]
MKLLITIIIVMVNYSVLFSQGIGIDIKLSNEYLITNQIKKLEQEFIMLNSINRKEVTFTIQIDSINYFNETSAIANCNIYNITNNNFVSHKNEKILLVKNTKWEVDKKSLGDWYNVSEPQIANKKKSNTINSTGAQMAVQSGEEFTIRMSESTFINYPFADGMDEIGSDITNANFGVQLFAHSTSMDGAVIYDRSQTYYKTGFIIDPRWYRIIYARQTGLNKAVIKEFTATDNHPLTYITAIASKNDGSIFIADYGSSQILRLEYDNPSHQITIPSNSLFLDITKVLRPVDIELTEDGVYLFVCDLGSKSVKKFDMNGNLVIEFTGDANYTLNKPLFVQPYESFILVVDQNPNGEYKLVYIVTSLPYPIGYTKAMYEFPSGSIPSDLSGIWDSEMVLVPDKGLNMVHVFGANYVCSYNGTNNPTQSTFTKLGRMPNMYNMGEGQLCLEGIVFDSWRPQGGFNRVILGVDLFDLELRYSLISYQSVMVDFTVTTLAKCTYELFRKIGDDYTLVHSNEYMTFAGRQGYPMDFEGYQYGFYKLRITAIPFFNYKYGSYSMEPITKEITFYYGDENPCSKIYVGEKTLVSNKNQGTLQLTKKGETKNEK